MQNLFNHSSRQQQITQVNQNQQTQLTSNTYQQGITNQKQNQIPTYTPKPVNINI